MRLTQWTDYTLRVLMYCAATQGREQPVTITEVAEGYGISRSHLMKIVQELAAQGWLETTRGRGGGMRLMKPPSEINLGAVVRQTETDFHLVECFDPATTACGLGGRCALQLLLTRAGAAFIAVLDGATLADMVPAPSRRVSPPTSRRQAGIPGPRPAAPTVQTRPARTTRAAHAH